MIVHSVWQKSFDFFSKPVVVEPSESALTSDAGLLPIRQRDPLGAGQPGTWRMLLIKVAARMTERARRVRVELSGSWPYLAHYRHVCERVLAFCAAADTS